MHFDGMENMTGDMARSSASDRDLDPTEGTPENTAITSGIDVDMELTGLRYWGGDEE